MLILRVLQSGSLHGYALAQRIHVLSSEVLAVEEGLLYPTLQKNACQGLGDGRMGHLGDQPQGTLLSPYA
jgi:DNA-binding PadR family transcriptional regulator